MVDKALFENATTLQASSFKELLGLVEQYRAQHKTRPLCVLLNGVEEEGEYVFPYSYVYIKVGKHALFTSHYANELDENGEERTTWKTAALKITGEHNIFENLVVENRAGNPKEKGQEVALGIYAGDNLFLHCRFRSTQDTLFVGPLPDDLSTRYIDFLPQEERYYEGLCRSYFLECEIAGSVDFIFGAGQAVFDRCSIITVDDGRDRTWVAAPSHSLKDDFGYLFSYCSFVHEENVTEGSTYLARPWRDYGKCVFYRCHYDDHIAKDGFDEWNDLNRYRTARFLEYPLREGRVSWAKTIKNLDAATGIEALLEEIRKQA